MRSIEQRFWRGFFLVLTAVLFPFMVALSILAVLFTWGAYKLWKFIRRLAEAGGYSR